MNDDKIRNKIIKAIPGARKKEHFIGCLSKVKAFISSKYTTSIGKVSKKFFLTHNSKAIT
jgi:hypothetical protein